MTCLVNNTKYNKHNDIKNKLTKYMNLPFNEQYDITNNDIKDSKSESSNDSDFENYMDECHSKLNNFIEQCEEDYKKK